ncbi:arylsulfatase B-like [Rhipicephalus sanguineus]|uniref:arylsulfatase B-like n=1 Tax=Rhipicephalus sanguineus TaxID=34632 RepID=UPI0020C41B9F|nr:arylsulfatase B-like [Rhipicephalus sanguineus]
MSPAGLLQPLDVPFDPFFRVGLDLLGSFPASVSGNKWIAVATDYTTRPTKSIVFFMLFATSQGLPAEKASKPPHIIFILADDLGWNDVSFHGSRQIPTPNIDALAATGIILQRHYTPTVCTPSRASLFTSIYPARSGVGYGVLVPAAKAAVPLKYELLPQWFKRLGYSTHMVGKWHLGYRSMEHTPTWRGFDTFFGYYNGEMAYYNHTVTGSVTDLRGTYSTQAFTDEAKHIIANHNVEEPLFLYLSYQAVHSTCEDTKPEAPQETVDKYSYITNYNRSVFAGALHVLDHSVGEVLSALQSRDMLADSVVVFTSDNGGGPMDASLSVPNTGNNWPLRGSKGDMWEGGMRVPAVLWYGRLNSCRPRRPSQQLMHIVDWGPTLYAAAGGDVSDLGDVDGRNLWEALTTFKDIGHEDVVLEIEGWKDAAAIISGRYKLVNRSEDPCEPYLNNRVPLPEGDPPGGLDLDALMVSSDAWKAVHEATIHSDPRFWSPPRPNWRQEATIACSASGEPTVNFDPCEDVFVFDIFNDPCELNNLASSQPELRDGLLKKLATYRLILSPRPSNAEVDERGHPQHHDCTWSPWVDVEPSPQMACPC